MIGENTDVIETMMGENTDVIDTMIKENTDVICRCNDWNIYG